MTRIVMRRSNLVKSGSRDFVQNRDRINPDKWIDDLLKEQLEKANKRKKERETPPDYFTNVAAMVFQMRKYV